MPTGAIIRPIQYAPITKSDNQPSGQISPGPEYKSTISQSNISPEQISEISQRTVSQYPQAPFREYTVINGYWYGVQNIGGETLYTKLNEASPGSYPNPGYTYQRFSSIPSSVIQPGERPTPPSPGSPKSEWRAYSEALASWERASFLREMDTRTAGMSWDEVGRAWENIRLPNLELRAQQIFEASMPKVPSEKYLSLLSQYQQQKQNIVSSSGLLVPTGAGFVNLTTGESIIPSNIQAAPIPSGPEIKLPTELPSPITRGLMGQIAYEKLGMDYLIGGTALVQGEKPFSIQLPTIPQETAVKIRETMLSIPVVGNLYSAGEYIGADIILSQKIAEYEKTYSQFQSQGLISGNVFKGTEQQFAQLNRQFEEIQRIQSLQTQAAERALGVSFPELRTQTAVTGKAYEIGHGVTEWLNTNVISPGVEMAGKLSPALPVLLGGMAVTPIPTQILPRTFEFSTGLVKGVASVPEYVGMVVVGAEGLIKHPQGLPGAIVLGGYIQAKGAYEGITTRPVEFAGELVGSAIGLHAAGKGISRVTGLGFGLSEIPTGKVERIISYEGGKRIVTEKPISVTISGLYWRNPLERPFIGKTETLSARPLFGLTWGKPIGGIEPFVGRYILPTDVPIGAGYIPITPSDWAFARPTMESRLTTTGFNFYNIWEKTFKARGVAYGMEGSLAPELEEPWGRIAPTTIGEPAWREVTEYIRKFREDMVVYGSTTVRTFTGEYGRITLGDLDVNIRPDRAKIHAENIYNIVKKYRPELRELVHETSMITGETGRYTARLPSGEIVLDLHPYWEAKWDTPKSGLVESGGIRMMPLSRTVWGKTMFFLQYREIGPGMAVIEPYSGRFKDPADLALIMGKYTRDVLNKPLKWDINRIRSLGRLKLAQESAEISVAFEEYTRRYAREGIPLIEEARPALRGLDLTRAPKPEVDIRAGSLVEINGEWYLHPAEINMYNEVKISAARGVEIPENVFATDKFGREVKSFPIREIGRVDIKFGRGTKNAIAATHTHPTGTIKFEPLFDIKSLYLKKILTETPILKKYFKDISQFEGPDLVSLKLPIEVKQKNLPLHHGDFSALIYKKFSIHGVISEDYLQVGKIGSNPRKLDVNTIFEETKIGWVERYETIYKNLLKSEKVGIFDLKKRAEINMKAYSEAMYETIKEIYEKTGGSYEKIPIKEVIDRSIGQKSISPEQKIISDYYTPNKQLKSKIYPYLGYSHDFIDRTIPPKEFYEIKKALSSKYPFIPVVKPTGKYPSVSYSQTVKYPQISGYTTTEPYKSVNYPSGVSYPKVTTYLTIGKYPSVSYPGQTKYPATPSYPIPGKYSSVNYPVPQKYPGIPTYPVSGKYPSVPRPSVPEYPKVSIYPGNIPTTTKYPGISKLTQVYPSTIKPGSQKQPITKPGSFVFRKLPKEVTFTLPRPKLLITKETPKKKKGIRKHFDVMGSKWNIRSPVPRPGISPLTGPQLKNELKIYNLMKSRKRETYEIHGPFEKIEVLTR